MTARPRILQVLYSGLGGHAAVAQTLVYGGGSDDPWDHHMLFYGIEQVAESHIDYCNVHKIPWDYVPAREGRPRSAWSELQATVQRIAPDAIILHSIKTVMPMRMAARRTPLIAVEHQPNALKSRSEWVASAMAQTIADRVVTLSPNYRDTLRRKLGPFWREHRNVLVPTGIALDQFNAINPPAAADSTQTLRIGMAARFSPTKTQETLVWALGLLRKEQPGRPWRLDLAGDGVCYETVVRAVDLMGLQDAVDLRGHLPVTDLPAWFGSLDLYAHSSDGETLSTALLQAMAAGVPVIASDVAGISDLLGPPARGEAPLGRLVAARDAEAFAAAILADAQDPDGAALRSTRARAHVLRHHSPTAMRAGYAALLKDIV